MRSPWFVAFALSAAASGQQAAFTPYGAGCYDQTQSFYELFLSGAFDLGPATGTNGFTLFPTGTGYAFVPVFSAWRTPLGTGNLTLGDDQVSGANPLGFPFPFPGGSTSNLFVSSNGFVWLQANTNSWCCSGSASGLLTGGNPRFCGMWMDLNPFAGGMVNFEVDAGTQTAYVTWTGVPEYGRAGSSNTFQMSFSSSGIVECMYQGCINAIHDALTGWSPGVNARDGGSIDLSTATPFVTAPDLFALQLTSTNRPIVGTNMPLQTRQIPPGSAIGALRVSLTQHNPGMDLSALGLGGCTQFVGTEFGNVFVPVGGQGTFNWLLPNLPQFAGMLIYCQSVVSAPGVNQGGWLTSNGVELRIGTF